MAVAEILSKDHTILERPFMEFRPFGVDEFGEKIRDISGVIVKANVDHLKKHIARTKGPEDSAKAVDSLCLLLNERLRDSAYHVTPAFLTNEWNSYSYEFTCYLREFGKQLTGDPLFVLHTAVEQHISPLIQVLCRPFSMGQIYGMTPHLAAKFSKGILVEVVHVHGHSAVQRMTFTERAYAQFGPYRRACAGLTCQAAKGGLIALPAKVHHLPSATVTDLTCMVEGDDWCTYEVEWIPSAHGRVFQATGALLQRGAQWLGRGLMRR
jgi:hypothetical protein